MKFRVPVGAFHERPDLDPAVQYERLLAHHREETEVLIAEITRLEDTYHQYVGLPCPVIALLRKAEERIALDAVTVQAMAETTRTLNDRVARLEEDAREAREQLVESVRTYRRRLGGMEHALGVVRTGIAGDDEYAYYVRVIDDALRTGRDDV